MVIGVVQAVGPGHVAPVEAAPLGLHQELDQQQQRQRGLMLGVMLVAVRPSASPGECDGDICFRGLRCNEPPLQERLEGSEST